MTRIGLIGHDTIFTMELLNQILILGEKNTVFFVPMRLQVSKDGVIPILPNGIISYTNNDKYRLLLSNDLSLIFTFTMNNDFLQELLNLETFPRLIFLMSKTAINDYEKIDTLTRLKLTSIKFICFAVSELKWIDSYLGVGESSMKLFRRLNINLTSNILVLGYGKTGQGICDFLSNYGYYNISVYDIDIRKRIIAKYSGLNTDCFEKLAIDTDVVFDTTGDSSIHLSIQKLELFKKDKVSILSTSTVLNMPCETAYTNSNGTIFDIESSRGMINMKYDIGGSSNQYMAVTGLVILYFCSKYDKFIKNLNKYLENYNDNSYILNSRCEKCISKFILQRANTFGRPRGQFYNSNNLSLSELTNAIVGKIGIHQSLSSPNRSYKIYYKSDFSFTIDTIENCNIIGTSTGTYKIIKYCNYDIGIIDVSYTQIYESPFKRSIFNKENPHSVFKTFKNQLGPFSIINTGKNGTILKYLCGNDQTNLVITMFNNEQTN